MRNLTALASLLAVVLFCAWVHAAQTQTGLAVNVRAPQVVLTTVAQGATVAVTDTGTNASKRKQVVKLTDVNGREFHLLIRVEQAPNGLFVDVIGEATVGELSTRVAAMNITGSSHPTPAADAIDTAVMLVATDGS